MRTTTTCARPSFHKNIASRLIKLWLTEYSECSDVKLNLTPVSMAIVDSLLWLSWQVAARKLKPHPPRPRSLHERLLEDIKAERKLRPVSPDMIRRNRLGETHNAQKHSWTDTEIVGVFGPSQRQKSLYFFSLSCEPTAWLHFISLTIPLGQKPLTGIHLGYSNSRRPAVTCSLNQTCHNV